MYSELDTLGLGEILGPIILIATVGGVILTILGLLYAVRSWMAQAATFQTRKDVAEIKRLLNDRPVSPPTSPPATPPNNGPSSQGRVIAKTEPTIDSEQ